MNRTVSPFSTSGSLQTLIKPAAVGVTAGLVTKIIAGPSNVNILGYSIDPFIAIGLAAGAASFITESTKNQILPAIGVTDQFSNAALYVGQPLITGAAVLGMTMAFDGFKLPNMNDALQAVALGAGAEIVGRYASDAYIKPMVGSRL